MNPLPETRGLRKRERTRRAILDAAERHFGEAGYRRTRMEDVAEDADVAVGSIYGHFGNKDGLYLAAVERAADLFAGYLHAAFRPEWTALEQVVAAGDAYLRFHVDHPGSFRMLAFDGVETEVPVVDPDLRARVAARIDGLITEFEGKIRAAVESGEARPVDPRLTGRFLWGAWNGVVALGLRTDGVALGGQDIAAALQQARDIVMAGLCSPEHRDAAGDPRPRLVTVAPPADRG